MSTPSNPGAGFGIKLKTRVRPDALKKQIAAAREQAAQKLAMTISETELRVLLETAMGMAIYDQPVGEYYRRTGRLLRAIRTKQAQDGAAVWVDKSDLEDTKNGDYSGYTALDETTGAVSGQGYFMPAFDMIFAHVMRQLRYIGKYRVVQQERT